MATPSTGANTPKRSLDDDTPEYKTNKKARRSSDVSIMTIDDDADESIGNATEVIVIDSDDDSTPFGDSLSISGGSGVQQLRRFINQIEGGTLWIEVKWLAGLSTWLQHHLTLTERNWDTMFGRYQEEVDFFQHLAVLALRLTDTDEVFETGPAHRSLHTKVCVMSYALFLFSLRMTTLLATHGLPQLRQEKDLSSSKSQQRLFCTLFPYVAAKLLDRNNKLHDYLSKGKSQDYIRDMEDLASRFVNQVPSAPGHLIDFLANAMPIQHHLADRWYAVNGILHILPAILESEMSRPDLSSPPKKCVNTIRSLIVCMRDKVVPMMAKIHPGVALVNTHQNLITTVLQVLDHALPQLSFNDIRDLHELCLSSSLESDFVPDLTHHGPSNGGDLLKIAWKVFVSTSLLRSEISKIQTLGLDNLKSMVFMNRARSPRSTLGNDPTADYLGASLVHNHFVNAICGPDIEPTLLKQATPLFALIVETGDWHPDFSDALWRVCLVNGEVAEHAAFFSIAELIKHMDSESLLHLFGKCAAADPMLITPQAAQFFGQLLLQLRGRGQSNLILQTCIDTVVKYQDLPSTDATNEMRESAAAELLIQLKEPTRDQIFSTCADMIIGGQHDSSGYYLLNLILMLELSANEFDALLNSLSFKDILTTFCAWAARQVVINQQTMDHVRMECRSRLGCILRLINSGHISLEREDEVKLWRHTIGEAITDTNFREVALHAMLHSTDFANANSIAAQYVESQLQRFILDLNPGIATNSLIDYLKTKLEEQVSIYKAEDHKKLWLDTRWSCLLRIALSCIDSQLAWSAWQMIFELLLETIELPALRETLVASLVDHCFRLLYQEQHINPDDKTPRSTSVAHALHFMHSFAGASAGKLKSQSKTWPTIVVPPASPDTHSGSSTFHLKLKGPIEPCSINVKVMEDSRVGTLLDVLREQTGVESHIMKIRGSDTDAESCKDLLLRDMNSSRARIIDVTPRPSLSSDFAKVFRHFDLVLKALQAHRTELEELLSNHEGCNTALALLQSLEIADLRSSVLDAKKFEQYWPDQSGSHQLIYSIAILQCYHKHCRQLQLFDGSFTIQSIATLQKLLSSEHASTDTAVVIRVTEFITELMLDLQEHGIPELMVQSERQAGTNLQDVAHSPNSVSTNPDVIQAVLTSIVHLLLQVERRSTEQASLREWSYLFIEGHRAMTLIIKLRPELWFHVEQADGLVSAYRFIYQSSTKAGTTALEDMICAASAEQEQIGSGYALILARVVRELVLNSKRAIRALESLQKLLTEQYSHAQGVWQDLLGILAGIICEYKHTESYNSVSIDITLSLLLACISTCLESLLPDTTLQLDLLADSLIGRYLFPSDITNEKSPRLHNLDGLEVMPKAGAAAPPCLTTEEMVTGEQSMTQHVALPLISDKNRDTCYSLLEKIKGTAWVVQRMIGPLAEFVNINNDAILRDNWAIREPNVTGGLANLGMTCYMNSLLQQIFGNLRYRKTILHTTIMDSAKQQLVIQLQTLFSRMQDLIVSVLGTQDLAACLKVAHDVQEDVHSFYSTFISTLEEQILDPEQRKQFIALYSGKMVTQVRGECGHISSTTDSFSDLSITVHNKSGLEESLEEFVQGEKMRGANRYRCTTCQPDDGGKLVDAMKRTCLVEVPDVLTLSLKRFNFDVGLDTKNNDAFDFPERIDLAPYQLQHLENPLSPFERDVFVLTGIIVHYGTSTFGHYWSYVRRRAGPGQWMRAEDAKVNICNSFDEIRRACIGGDGSRDNAYVLIYERESSYFESTQSIVKEAKQENPTADPKIVRCSVPADIMYEMHQMNKNLRRTTSAFSENTQNLVETTMEQTISAMDNTLSDKHTSDRFNPETPDRSNPAEDFISQSSYQESCKALARLGVSYLSHVILARAPDYSLTNFVKDLMLPIRKHPTFAAAFIDAVAEQTGIISRWYFYEQSSMRSDMSKAILLALTVMNGASVPSEYLGSLERLLASHADMMRNGNIDQVIERWREYLSIVADIASKGQEELVMVVQAGYVDWATETLAAKWPASCKNSRQEMLGKVYAEGGISIDLLLHFLNKIFKSLDVTDQAPFDHGGKLVKAAVLIFMGEGEDDLLGWFQTACAHPPDAKSWESLTTGLIAKGLVSSPDERIVSRTVQQVLQALETNGHYETVSIVVLQCCLAIGDGEHSSAILRKFVKAYTEKCSHSRKLVFDVLLDVVHQVPRAVTSTISLWFETVLSAKGSDTRERATRLLDQIVHFSDPITNLTSQPGADQYNAMRVSDFEMMLTECLRLQKEQTGSYAMRSNASWTESVLMHCVRFGQQLEKELAEAKESLEEGVNIELGDELTNAVNKMRTACSEALKFVDTASDSTAEDDDDNDDDDNNDDDNNDQA